LQKASPRNQQGIDRLEAELDFLMSEDMRIAIRIAQERTAAAGSTGCETRLRNSLLRRLGVSAIGAIDASPVRETVPRPESDQSGKDLKRLETWVGERAKHQ
jgi:hypothetical protein